MQMIAQNTNFIIVKFLTKKKKKKKRKKEKKSFPASQGPVVQN